MKKTLFILTTVLLHLSSFAQFTTIPDPNFEQSLIDQGYDSGDIDGKVLTENINTLEVLDVSDLFITDLTGIQDFVALQVLFCSSNYIESLDLSALSALTYLDCSINQLSSLNVSGLSALEFLDCSTNILSSFNGIELSSLSSLNCNFNNLTSLDVSGLPILTELSCSVNQLSELNLKNLPSLTKLDCSDNNLTSIDVSGLSILTNLSCSTNQLSELNLKELSSLTTMDCTDNPSLTCIQVDNTDTAIANSSWNKDETTSYSLNCSLDTNSFEMNKGIVVFPNPTQGILNLSATTIIDKIIISDLIGKAVLHQVLPSNQINVQHLAKGMYILQTFLGKEKFTTKFVKE